MRFLTPRRHIVAAVMVALMAGGVIARQQTWYEFYDSAKADIVRGAWEQAESKLQQAKKLGPAAGRNRLRYGMLRSDFFPDFYLGVVYLNTNRPAEALRQFALARAQKIDPDNREFQAIVAYEKEARTNEKLLADAAAIPTTPKKPVVTEPPPPETVKAENKTATPPSPPPVETKTADNAPSTATIERDRRRASAERDAMQSFFAGDYRKTVTTLDNAERELSTRLSPRGSFYRACAMAAQALRSSTVDQKMLAEARRHYAESIRDSQTALPDRRYVSPRILNALGS